MKTFKEFLKSVKKKKTNWLSWDQPHDKKEVSWLSWPSPHEMRDQLVKEEFIIEDWTNEGPEPKTKKSDTDMEYDSSFHDHPDVIPKKINRGHALAIDHYVAGGWNNPVSGPGTSRNINWYLRNRAGESDDKIKGGHSEDKVKTAINRLSSLFTPDNTNRKSVEVYSGVPQHIGKKLQEAGEGSTHYLPGFTSTSSSRLTAHAFARSFARSDNLKEQHVLHITAKPGTGVSLVHHSILPENEVLIHHGARLTYHGTTTHQNRDGTVTHVHNVTIHPDHKKLEDYGPYNHPTPKNQES